MRIYIEDFTHIDTAKVFRNTLGNNYIPKCKNGNMFPFAETQKPRLGAFVF